MFDRFVSSFVVKFKVEPQTGFLISSGKIPLDPIEPDMSFIRAKTTYSQYPLPYIPGSSFKGPIRAFAESLLRSKDKKAACDLNTKNCMQDYKDNNKKDKEDKGIKRYKHACLACRMFGSTMMASKLRFDDLLPYKSVEQIPDIVKLVKEKSVVRNGIKIDRRKGNVVKGALFFYESLTIPFYGSIAAKNPEKWQLALLFSLFDCINLGYIKFGHSKSRGLGKLKLEIESVDIAYIGEKLRFWSINGDDEEFDFEIHGNGELLKTITLEGEKLKDFVDRLKKETQKELEKAVNTLL